MNLSIITSFIFTAIRVATPLIYGALAVCITKQAGLLNMATESMMLSGALCGVLASGYTQSLVLGVLGGSPRRRAVFLAVAGPALIRPIKQNCHAISGEADEDGGQAFVRPHDICRLLQCAGQIPQQLRQPAAKGLRQQERKPDDGDYANEVKQGVV